MLLRDECWKRQSHSLDWDLLGCPQVQQSPCVVTMTTVEVAAFSLPHRCIPEPTHVINHVAFFTLFITHCIIDVVSFECKPHHFIYTVHCVCRSVRHKDVVTRFSKALDFSAGVGGWWKIPKLSLICKRLFPKTQRPQRKLRCWTPADGFLFHCSKTKWKPVMLQMACPCLAAVWLIYSNSKICNSGRVSTDFSKKAQQAGALQTGYACISLI